MDEFTLLSEIEDRYVGILKDNLVGIYVHGSIVFHCFNWHKSGIDFVVVVKRPLTEEQKEAMIEMLLEEDSAAPKKGFEMSVVLLEHCQHFVYPTPYELHFSKDDIKAAKADLKAFCTKSHGEDRDLAAHFTIIKTMGIVIYGQHQDKVFSSIPKETYVDSIKFNIQQAEAAMLKRPIYVILSLCRVLAYLKEGRVLSKKDGGEWGLTHLPAEYAPLIKEALDSYTSDKNIKLDLELSNRYVTYMNDQILH